MLLPPTTTLLLLLMTVVCTFPCADTPLTLNLYDSYGDGWNGGSLTINGTPYTQSDDDYSSPYTANTAESFYICIDLTVCTDVIYAAGLWAYENSWEILNSDALIASGGYANGTVGCVFGCTDATAFNYNVTVNANTDDGSCIEVVYGCTDDNASNYDAYC